MTDAFVRQRLNQLTGLTKYTQKSGTSTIIPASTWTALTLSGISDPTDLHLIVTAYKLTADVGDMSMRMVVDTEKVFPHGDDMEVISGVDQYLHFPLQVPVGHSFSVEVFTPTGGNANIDYLSVIEVETYDHA